MFISPAFNKNRRPFTLEVKSDNAGTSNDDQFTIPLHAIGEEDFYIKTSEGYVSPVITTDTDSELTITFSGGAGTYTVEMHGKCTSLRFYNAGDTSKVLDIQQWGTLGLLHSRLFRGCENMLVSASDRMNLSITNSFLELFFACGSITTLTSLLRSDTGRITDFQSFLLATSSLTEDLGTLDTSSATNISYALKNSSVDCDIGGWDMSNVTDATDIIKGSSMSIANYGLMLEAMDRDGVSGCTIGAGSIKYPASAATARTNLINRLCTIMDGGLET